MENKKSVIKCARYGSFLILFFYAMISLAAIYIPNCDIVYSMLSVFALIFYLALNNVKLILSRSRFLAESNFSIISFLTIFLVACYHHQIIADNSLNIIVALGNCATAIGFLTIFWDFVSDLSNALSEC